MLFKIAESFCRPRSRTRAWPAVDRAGLLLDKARVRGDRQHERVPRLRAHAHVREPAASNRWIGAPAFSFALMGS